MEGIVATEAADAFGAPPQRKRGSTLGYWLAGLVAILAIAGAIAWFVTGITSIGDAVDELARVPVPGQDIVHLDKGRSAAYWEGSGSAPALRIAIRALDGAAVPVGPRTGDTSYDIDGHDGQSVAGFDVPADGRYRVTVLGPEGGTLALGHGVGGRIVSAVVGGLGIFFGGLLLSGVLIILTARGRRT